MFGRVHFRRSETLQIGTATHAEVWNYEILELQKHVNTIKLAWQ